MRNLGLTHFRFFSGLSLFGLVSLSAMANDNVPELSERYRRLLSHEVNEMEEAKRIFRMVENLPSLTHDESMALLHEVSIELAQVFKSLEDETLDFGEINRLKSKGRNLISQLLAIGLKTPKISSWVEAWLDRNRKSFTLLSEALVVTAAIIGAEIALKEGAAGINLFLQSFTLSLGSVFAMILPARWFWHYQNQKSLDRALHVFFELDKSQDKNSLSKNLGYPQRIFDCTFMISQLRKQRSDSH